MIMTSLLYLVPVSEQWTLQGLLGLTACISDLQEEGHIHRTITTDFVLVFFLLF